MKSKHKMGIGDAEVVVGKSFFVNMFSLPILKSIKKSMGCRGLSITAIKDMLKSSLLVLRSARAAIYDSPVNQLWVV